MNNCLHCSKELVQIEGRRQKKFCDSNCRVAYWLKVNGSKKPKTHKVIPVTEYENLLKQMANMLDLTPASKDMMDFGMAIMDKEGNIIPIESEKGQELLSKVTFQPISNDSFDGKNVTKFSADESALWNNDLIHTTPKGSVTVTLPPANGKTELADWHKKQIEQRILDIEAELKKPPKNPLIGLRTWTRVRQEELAKLKKELN